MPGVPTTRSAVILSMRRTRAIGFRRFAAVCSAERPQGCSNAVARFISGRFSDSFAVFVVVLIAAGAPRLASASTFEAIEISPVEAGAKIPTAISRDGESVVGRVPQIGSGGFRWRRGVGFDVLPVFDNLDPAQEFSIPFALSDDGATAVGEAYTDRIDARTAFLARANGSIVDLGLFMRADTEFSSANGISADGSIIVGSGYGATHGTEAYLYDDVHGLRYLKDLVSAPIVTHAEDVSADGSTLVGWQLTPLGNAEAMIFSEATGIERLGDLDGEPRVSRATAISSDGSTVVGHSSQNLGQDTEAFLWTRTGGMRGLGRLFGGDSEAYDVSGDGSVVVGDGTGYTFIYTETHGMMETRNYLSQVGGIPLAGWEILIVAGVSDDGATFTGWARDPQDDLVTWVATVPEPRAGLSLLAGVVGLIGLGRGRRRSAISSDRSPSSSP